MYDSLIKIDVELLFLSTLCLINRRLNILVKYGTLCGPGYLR